MWPLCGGSSCWPPDHMSLVSMSLSVLFLPHVCPYLPVSPVKPIRRQRDSSGSRKQRGLSMILFYLPFTLATVSHSKPEIMSLSQVLSVIGKQHYQVHQSGWVSWTQKSTFLFL